MRQQVDEEVARLLAGTGFRVGRYTTVWAKVEILLGLATIAGSVLFGMFLYHHTFYGWRSNTEPWMWSGPVILFACGGYLALAGHRSHQYQSHNRLVAYLAAVIRDPGNRHEHSG